MMIPFSWWVDSIENRSVVEEPKDIYSGFIFTSDYRFNNANT